jgi:hypothetical protein
MRRHAVTNTVLAPVVALFAQPNTTASDAVEHPESDLRTTWDELREAATTSQERSEIDAIFSRYVA